MIGQNNKKGPGDLPLLKIQWKTISKRCYEKLSEE